MGRKQKWLRLTCNREWCSWEDIQKVDVVPSRAWHEYEKLGAVEQHLVNIEMIDREEEE